MKEYKAPILSVYDDDGNKISIPAIKGENGKDGKDGVQVNDNVTNTAETWSSQKITDELNRPQHNTMRITATKNPLGSGYISDYSSSEIKNWVDAGGDAELYFEDTIEGSGEQIYHYIKFQNRTAYFRRNVLTEGEVRQIDIEIYERNIKFTDLKQKFATPDDIQMLEDSKANYTHKVIASDKVSQLDALEILNELQTYDGKLIEFLTNGENPSKAVATGRVFTTTQGDSYLITYNLDGTTTVWNKDNYEKHQIETSSLINAGLVDVDNLTVDIQGDAPHLYSVRDAMNTPNSIKGDGCVFVLPHSLNKQIQHYIDMTTGNQWYRLVTGSPDAHSFGVWQEMGGSSGGEVWEDILPNLTLYDADLVESEEMKLTLDDKGRVVLGEPINPTLCIQSFKFKKPYKKLRIFIEPKYNGSAGRSNIDGILDFEPTTGEGSAITAFKDHNPTRLEQRPTISSNDLFIQIEPFLSLKNYRCVSLEISKGKIDGTSINDVYNPTYYPEHPYVNGGLCYSVLYSLQETTGDIELAELNGIRNLLLANQDYPNGLHYTKGTRFTFKGVAL